MYLAKDRSVACSPIGTDELSSEHPFCYLTEHIPFTSLGVQTRIADVCSVSSPSRPYTKAHQLSVDGIGDAVDLSLTAMSSLMMGCEQVSENMPPVDRLVEQLRGVKKTLSILEDAVNAPPMDAVVMSPEKYYPGSV